MHIDDLHLTYTKEGHIGFGKIEGEILVNCGNTAKPVIDWE